MGWNVGESNVWIAAARLLYCFDFIEDKVFLDLQPKELIQTHLCLTSILTGYSHRFDANSSIDQEQTPFPGQNKSPQ